MTSPSITFTINVQPSYLTQIRSSEKTIEGRTATPRYLSLTPNQTVIFADDDNTSSTRVCCKVTSLTRYATFEAMLRAVGVAKCLPGCGSVEEGVAIYRGFEGYVTKERKFGVLAIGVRVVDDDDMS